MNLSYEPMLMDGDISRNRKVSDFSYLYFGYESEVVGRIGTYGSQYVLVFIILKRGGTRPSNGWRHTDAKGHADRQKTGVVRHVYPATA